MQLSNDKDGYVTHFDDFDEMEDEDLQKFLLYAFKYARDNTEPELKGLEKTVWKHIQKRMDYDNEIELEGIEKSLFTLIKPQIENKE